MSSKGLLTFHVTACMYFGFVIGRICQVILFMLVAIHCCTLPITDAGKMIRARLICFLTVGIFAVIAAN